MPVSFDGPSVLITLDTADFNPKAAEIYSDWKRWFISDEGAKFHPAFDVVGGDPIDIALGDYLDGFLFFRNDLGWRIKPAEQNGSWDIQGNLYPRDSTIAWKNGTDGNFNTSLDRTVSSRATRLDVGSGLSEEDRQMLMDIKDILESDEEVRQTTYRKLHKDTKAILLDKSVTRSGDDIDLVEA